MTGNNSPHKLDFKGIPSLLRTPAFLFFLLCWVTLASQFAFFFFTSKVNVFPAFANILLSLCDSLVILSPYFLLKPAWRKWVIIPMTLIPIYIYANVLYFRNLTDIIGISTILGATNLTGAVSDSAFASVAFRDLWLLFGYLLFLVFYILKFKKLKDGRFSPAFKLSAMIAVIGLLLCELAWLEACVEVEEQSDGRGRAVSRDIRRYNYKNMDILRSSGFPGFWVKDLYRTIRPRKYLGKSERKEIAAELARRRLRPLVIDSLPDNRDKNLIFIIVESLNSDALHLHSRGKELMPFTTSLLGLENVIVADNVSPQIDIGRSSDGRFMYQTGLLPIPGNPVAMSFPDDSYPSIRKAFSGEAREFDSGYPGQWHKERMSVSLGYDTIYSNLARGRNKFGGKDGALFHNSMPMIKEMRQPFLAVLCTMDMHDPYDKFYGTPSDAWNDFHYSIQERVYIEKVRQFDRALGEFVAMLKEAGLYDNSVIVIAGDHNANEKALTGERFTGRAIPLIILNSGIDLRTDAAVGQIDVYPTLLDVMGVSGYSWKGFGTSLLRNPKAIKPKEPGDTILDPLSYPSPADWSLSEKMVSGGYFARSH